MGGRNCKLKNVAMNQEVEEIQGVFGVEMGVVGGLEVGMRPNMGSLERVFKNNQYKWLEKYVYLNIFNDFI